MLQRCHKNPIPCSPCSIQDSRPRITYQPHRSLPVIPYKNLLCQPLFKNFFIKARFATMVVMQWWISDLIFEDEQSVS